MVVATAVPYAPASRSELPNAMVVATVATISSQLTTGHIDLAVNAIRGLADGDAGKPTQLHGLAGHRKGSGDDGLARDDGGNGRERDQRIDRPARARSGKTDCRVTVPLLHQERGLPGVAQEQCRQHDRVPGPADRPLTEVAHVGVQRLSAGDAQKYAAEHQKAAAAGVAQESDRVARIERDEHLRDAGQWRIRPTPR